MAVTVGILRDEAGNYFLPQTDASLVSGLSAYTLPAGGQVGQVLAKATSSDYDVHWVNQSGGGGGGGGDENVIEEIQVNGSPITPVNKVVNIPVPTENTVTSWGFTKNAGTITGITMNGVSKGTSGVVDLGTVLTSSDAFELLANKKTAWSSTVSDTNYPSEKLVKDSLDAIHQIPSGGTTGQILKKASNTNYDLVWANESGGGGDPTNAVLYTAQSLTAEQQTQARTNIGAGTYSKPSGGIPSTDLASGVIPDVSGFYTKPVDGIPATDLESGVIPDITGKADKVTSATNGNFAALDSNGNLTDSGHKHSDYLTSHQDISGKEDKSNKKTTWSSTTTDTNYPSEKLVKDSLDNKQNTIDSTHKLDYSLIDNTPTIPTVPTISTDIVADKASTTKTAAPKAVYDEIHPIKASSQPAGGMLANKLYEFGTLDSNTTFILATPSDSNITNHWFWIFDIGSTVPTITWPNAIDYWYGGSQPTLSANKHYEISVLNGVAICMEV